MRSGRPPSPPIPTVFPGSARLDDTEVGRVDLGVVHLPGDAQFDTEVVRADENDVDAVYGRDGVDRVQARLGFDHRDHHGGLVELADDLVGGEGAVVQLGRCARQRALAQGGMLDGAHRGACLVGGLHAGHDDPHGAGVHDSGDEGRVQAGYADKRSDAQVVAGHADLPAASRGKLLCSMSM